MADNSNKDTDMGKIKVGADTIYKEAWRLLEKRTPLCVDCGQLCGGACCDDGGRDDAGMYLFCGEDVMYKNMPEWLRVEKSEFEYSGGKYAPIAMCSGRCERKMRPLSCRIFPLAPYKKENEPLRVIIDPRAKAMCPLARALGQNELEAEFVHAVKLVFGVLIRNKDVRDFIIEQSYLLDEAVRFF